MYRVSLPDRIHYAFDNTMSRGTIALIGLLGLLSTLVVVVIAGFVTVVGISPEGGEQLSFTGLADVADKPAAAARLTRTMRLVFDAVACASACERNSKP